MFTIDLVLRFDDWSTLDPLFSQNSLMVFTVRSNILCLDPNSLLTFLIALVK